MPKIHTLMVNKEPRMTKNGENQDLDALMGLENELQANFKR